MTRRSDTPSPTPDAHPDHPSRANDGHAAQRDQHRPGLSGASASSESRATLELSVATADTALATHRGIGPLAARSDRPRDNRAGRDRRRGARVRLPPGALQLIDIGPFNRSDRS